MHNVVFLDSKKCYTTERQEHRCRLSLDGGNGQERRTCDVGKSTQRKQHNQGSVWWLRVSLESWACELAMMQSGYLSQARFEVTWKFAVGTI